MRFKELVQYGTILSVTMLLAACPAASTHLGQNDQYNHFSLSGWLPFVRPKNLWVSMRAHFNLSGTSNASVEKKIDWYANRQHYLNQLAENAKPYIYYIYQQTQKRNMPAELALLPMVESNYNPFSFSRQGATGIWQMMPGTAAGYGVKINWWFDGRRNIVQSTKAALDHLAYLHDYFGNWLLAIAAYDSGQGTVQAAINYNRKHHKPTDFWSLPLPAETKNYVPKLLALANIIQHPAKYHLSVLPIPNQSYFSIVHLHKQMNINRIAKMANISIKEIRKLNPGFRRFATIPKGSYTLLLPRKKADTFKLKLAANTHHPIQWTHHVVQHSESLSTIAHRYHTNVKTLKHINHLPSNIIHVRQSLLVPHSRHVHLSKTAIASEKRIAEDKLPGPKRYVHTVKKRETLWTVAKLYHVTPAQIRYWNKLTYRAKVYPAQQVVIWKRPPRHKWKTYHYKIRKGDNLGVIAARFHTSIRHIKHENRLASDNVRIGQRLRITVHV